MVVVLSYIKRGIAFLGTSSGLKGCLVLITLACILVTGASAQSLPASATSQPGAQGSPVSVEIQTRQASAQPSSPEQKIEPTLVGISSRVAPQVIAVVHRSSGPKLHALLTMSGAQAFPRFDKGFVHTKIVAGFILPDGRSIVTRLPQAEAETLNLTAGFRPAAATANEDDLWVMRRDGTRFKANFVGLDGSTGLSLLEAEKPILPPSREDDEQALTTGQPISLFAPEPAAPEAPVSNTGKVYMRISEVKGQLTAIKRAPSGKAMQVTVRAERLSPVWTGGIAISEAGKLVGIVEQSETREARLVPADAVRAAATRVLARRASVRQPWLGARGDAVAMTPIEIFVTRGWPREDAQSLMRSGQGVLLTAVAPGTPAAMAGLRPGDVIARISEFDVRSTEDMSLMLKAVGGGVSIEFTVLRAQSTPLNLPVTLSESLNPAQATAEAEARAAVVQARRVEEEAHMAEAQLHIAEADFRTAETEVRAAELDKHTAKGSEHLAKVKARLKETEGRVAEIKAHLEKARLQVAQARAQMIEAEARVREVSAMQTGLTIKPLIAAGLEAITLAPEITVGYGPQNGLLVLAVRPESPAATGGLKVGDLIESVNGQEISGTGWSHHFSLLGNSDLSLGILRGGQKLVLNLSRRGVVK